MKFNNVLITKNEYFITPTDSNNKLKISIKYINKSLPTITYILIKHIII